MGCYRGYGVRDMEHKAHSVLTDLLDHQSSNQPHSMPAAKVCACTQCHSYAASSDQPGDRRAPNRVLAAL